MKDKLTESRSGDNGGCVDFEFAMDFDTLMTMKQIISSIVMLLSLEIFAQALVKGKVTAIDLSAMPRDGAGVVRVQVEKGPSVQILVPACEGPCDPKLNNYVFGLNAGQSVKLSHQKSGEYRLIPE